LFSVIAGVFGTFVCAVAVVSPDGRLLKALYLLIAILIAAFLAPHAFVPASLLLFAISTAMTSPLLNLGPASVYLGDLVVLLIAVRGALPRNRVHSDRPLDGALILSFGMWAIVMSIAAARALNGGISLDSVVRGDVALVYFPLLYFGFSRVLREIGLNRALLWGNLALVALGLVAWMFLARALNHPFNDPGLARVPTGSGETVLRNFGFASAFIVYPALALVGIAGMAHGVGRRWWWMLLASAGTIATLTTLVRGEIFSLALGAVLIFWIRSRSATATTARVRTALQIGFAVVIAVLGLIAVSPKFGNAIVQRAVPFTHQTPEAKANADFRWEAVRAGFRVARAHPMGLGVLDVAGLKSEDLKLRYPAHSGVATLLFFGGWPALITAILTVLALLRCSFRSTSSTPWLHPAFVVVLTMLTLYSIGAAGLAGDAWVIPIGAVAVALRFNLRPFEDPAR
jgi:hypothetical protein